MFSFVELVVSFITFVVEYFAALLLSILFPEEEEEA